MTSDAGPLWQALWQHSTRREYRRGAVIYSSGDISDEFYVVVAGRVKIALDQADGSERVLAIAEPGSTFGESACFDGLPYYAGATAVTDCTLRVIRRAVAVETCDSLSEGWASLVHALIRKQRQLAFELRVAGKPPTARVVMLLLYMMDAYGKVAADGSVHLTTHLSMEQLASLIGLTRVTMSREVSSLVRQGLARKDKWQIILVDPSRLRRLLQ